MTDEKDGDKPEPELRWDHWEHLIETTHDPIAIVDSEFVVLRFNQSFGALVPGFNSGRSFRDIVVPEHQEEWDACLRGSSDNNVISANVAVRSGELARWLAVRVLPIFDGGKPFKFVIVCIDLTETMNFETELRKRERLLQRAEQLGGLASWTWDIIDDRGYWSDNLFRLIGHEPQGFVPKYEMFMQIVHPDDRASLVGILAGIHEPNPKAQVNEFQSEFRMGQLQGRYVTMYSRGEVERNASGKAIRTTGIMLDVTERREYEKRLCDSEALLEATGQMAKVGGWELDCGSKEVTWTKETYRIHEVPFDQKPPLDRAIEFYHPEDRPTLELALENAINHGLPFDLELRFTTTKGKELFTRAICTPVFAGKTVAKLLGTFQDITEIKHMELALIASNEKLKREQQLLEEKNIALKEILSQIQDESNKIKQDISQNLEILVKPLLAKLRSTMGDRGRPQLDALETTISEITSPFITAIEKRFINLTPREMEICNHIRNGLRSKEIADLLNISVQTVGKFRQKIRNKLRIEGTSANLSSYLRSLKG